MQKLKGNESEKLDKEMKMWSQKCVELETNRVSEEKERTETLERMNKEIASLNEENAEISNEMNELKNDYEILLRNKEKNLEDTLQKEERTLDDLREKYNFLLNESENITQLCGQYDDPNFILMTLTNSDIRFLNKILVDLNNHIHGNEL